MRPELYGLVLAGGESRRMGQDKSSLQYHGQTQRGYVYDLLQKFCAQVWISARPAQIATWQETRPCLPDAFTGLGPMAALLTAFAHKPEAAWLIAACDMPRLDEDALAALVEARLPQKIATYFVNPEDVLPEPLLAIWEPAAGPRLQEAYQAGQYSLRQCLVLAGPQARAIVPTQGNFLENINDPQAWQRYWQKKNY
ncbi:MAG: hypothetical protein OHK0053_14780 [Microscillaceae bacterium]